MGDPTNYQKHLSPWIPETDLLRLAVLGKLQEELAECLTAASRCVIQGIDETEPETGVPNRQWLEDEIADTLAALQRAINWFALDTARIQDRREAKLAHFGAWDDLLLKEQTR